MGKHTPRTLVLVCTLSTQREGTILHRPRSQVSIAKKSIPIQEIWHKLF